MTMVCDFADGGIVTLPAQARQEDFGPGMGGRVACFGGGRVQKAADEAASQPEAPAGLDKEVGVIATRAATQHQDAGRGLHTGFLSGLVTERRLNRSIEPGFKDRCLDGTAHQSQRLKPIRRWAKLIGLSRMETGTSRPRARWRVIRGLLRKCPFSFVQGAKPPHSGSRHKQSVQPNNYLPHSWLPYASTLFATLAQ